MAKIHIGGAGGAPSNNFIKGAAVLMEAMRRNAPRAVVLYTGTRGQYGLSVKLPVNQQTPMNRIYEISNLTAEKIIQIYNDTHGIGSVMLRRTNVYSDITKIRTRLGWEPRSSLRDGIRQTVDYFRKNRSYYWDG